MSFISGWCSAIFWVRSSFTAADPQPAAPSSSNRLWSSSFSLLVFATNHPHFNFFNIRNWIKFQGSIVTFPTALYLRAQYVCLPLGPCTTAAGCRVGLFTGVTGWLFSNCATPCLACVCFYHKQLYFVVGALRAVVGLAPFVSSTLNGAPCDALHLLFKLIRLLLIMY